MKKLGLLIALTLLSSFCYSQEHSAAKYVILISIDGFKPDFYLDSAWHAPTLKRLMHEGIYAEGVKPVFPSVTYPNHISMITGVLPNKHGIYYNRPVHGKGRWNATMIKAPTVFDAVNQAGLTSSALFWPVTGNAGIQYNVPSVPTSSEIKNGMVVSKSVKGSVSPGLWQELEQHAIGKISVADARSDVSAGKMASYIIRTYKPTLTAIHLVGIDHAQHQVGLKNQSVADALLVIDNVINEIIQALDQAGTTAQTTLLITGDHGFNDVHLALAPNVWLKKHRIYKSGSRWKAKFYTSNGAAFLYLKKPDDERTVRRVMRILNNLPEEERSLFRIIEKDELHKIGGDPDAALALNPQPGIVLRQRGSGKLLKQATGGAHGYFADFPEIMTGFIGWGNGLHAGVVIPEMSVPDIAPIIARLLELNFVADDGHASEEIFIKR